jgi:prepilin-type N-terminal cleavage/methylation domain-containing protein
MKAVASGERRVASGPNRPDRPSRAIALPNHSALTTRHSFGYTLLELLLVIAILVIVASAVTPTVVARMAEYRLKQAAETARFALSATRIHAIDTCSTYQFRFEPGGRRYLAVPTDGDGASIAAQNAARQSSSGVARSGVEFGQLPEDLSFQVVLPSVPGSSPAPLAGSTDAAWSAGVARIPNAANFTSAVWSPPVVFRPDGTGTDAALKIVDRRGEGFQLKVRELTGEVSVAPLTTGTF